MKKLALIALVFVLTLSLTACFRRNDPMPSTNDTEPPTQTTTMPDPSTEPSSSMTAPDPSINMTVPDPSNGTIPGAANEDMYDNTQPSDGKRTMDPVFPGA